MNRNSGRNRRGRRVVVSLTIAALVAAGCSGSDEGAEDGSVPSASDPSGSSVPDSVADSVADSVFDPANPEGTAAPVPGTAVVLDDDVIIATEDGEIPTTTAEPADESGGVDAPPTTSATPTTRVTVPLPAPVDVGRIVSLSPTHTETLFALGLGEFVVGVDRESDFPAEAQALQRDGLSADTFDLSEILALDPDLVVIGDDPTDAAARLAAEGVASFVGPQPASLDEAYSQIRGIADLVDRPDLADDVIASMQFEIGRIQASLPESGALTYFHEIDPSLVTITAGSFLDSVYGELGLTSIIADRGSDPLGVVQLSEADVLAAGPDVILLADSECCRVTADVVGARAGWSGVPAVVNGAIVELPDDLVFRWGPRVVELVRLVAGGVAAAG